MTTKEISAVKIRARKDSFGRISVLVAHPFVESDAERQNNSQTDEKNGLAARERKSVECCYQQTAVGCRIRSENENRNP